VKFEKFANQGKYYGRQITDRFLEKGFLAVLFDNICLINTHLVCTYSKKFMADSNQLKQLEQVSKFMEQKEKIVLGGDLNFDEDSEYYQKLLPTFEDRTRALGASDIMNMRKIDFIMTKNLNSNESKSVFLNYSNEVSDHKGIICEISL
jgi:endonuclease/exonuclease/phosphatase family metal-dependent hydrolase